MTSESTLEVGTEHLVAIGPLAHGGHCIAHVGGRTVFVRHAWPGERARIRITEVAKRMVRADAVEIVELSADRIDPACAHAARCGGCDFQHVTPAAQRQALGQVVTDAFARIGGLEVDVPVRAVYPDDHGWRTRMTFAVDEQGRAGLRAHRSHEVVPIEACTIAHPDLPALWRRTWRGDAVTAVRSSTGELRVLEDGDPEETIVERVRHREFRIAANGFWQVHPQAPEVLVDAVLRLADPQPGERVADLYSGAGLFSAFLAEAVGATGRVLAIEGDRRAVAAAQQNLADLPQVRVRRGPVERLMAAAGPCDLVVLDPPRAGAKRALDAIIGSGAARIVYVSCDVATQARDIARLRDAGYFLDMVEAYDLFPMTHHLETVALLSRRGPM